MIKKSEVPMRLYPYMNVAVVDGVLESSFRDCLTIQEGLEILSSFIQMESSRSSGLIHWKILSKEEVHEFNRILNLMNSNHLFHREPTKQILVLPNEYEAIDLWLTKMSRFGTTKSWSYDKGKFSLTLY